MIRCPGYKVREATESDVDVLVDMRLRFFDYVLSNSNEQSWPVSDEVKAALPETYREWIAGNEALVVVAVQEDQNTPLAMAVVRLPRPGYYMPPASAHISSVWVEPGHRRRGICCLMLNRLFQWLREQGVRQLVLDYACGNEPAEAMWGKLGFKPVYTTTTAMLEDVWRVVEQQNEQRKEA